MVAAQSPPSSSRSASAGGPSALPLVATTTIFVVRALCSSRYASVPLLLLDTVTLCILRLRV